MVENHHSDREPPPRLARWTAAVLLCLLVLVFHWRLTLTSQFTWLATSQQATRTLAWLQLEATELRHGHVPLWDTTQTPGHSLWAQPESAVASPLTWVLLVMPLKDGLIQPWALHVWFVLLHLLAALFAYRAARAFELSRVSSIGVALVYALYGWMGNSTSPSMLTTAVWLPLIFLYTQRRRAVLAGFFLGLTALGGNWALALAAAVWLVYEWRRISWRGLLLSLMTALFAAAPLLLMSPGAWALPALPYPVLIPLLLAALAWGDRRFWPAVPAVLLGGLGVALLAGVGLERCRVPRWLAPAALVLGVGLLVRQYLLAQSHGFPGSVDTRLPMLALIALLAAGWLAALRNRALSGGQAVTLIIGLLMIEAANGAVLDMPTWMEPGRAAHVAPLAEYRPVLNVQPSVAVVAHFDSVAPNRVRARVTLSTPAQLTLAGATVPDWRATLDGSPEQLNVPVTTGVHTVEYRYRPMRLAFGAVLSLVSALAALAALLRRRRPA